MLPRLWGTSTVTLLLLNVLGCYSLQEPEEVPSVPSAPWYLQKDQWRPVNGHRLNLFEAGKDGFWRATTVKQYESFDIHYLKNPDFTDPVDADDHVVMEITIEIDSHSGNKQVTHPPFVMIPGTSQQLHWTKESRTEESSSPLDPGVLYTTSSTFYYHQPKVEGLGKRFDLDIYIMTTFRDASIERVDASATILWEKKKKEESIISGSRKNRSRGWKFWKLATQ